MKQIFTILLTGLLASFANAQQAPSSFSYQAVVRNSAGVVIANGNVSLRFTIHEGSAGGTVIYQEKQNKTTSNLGLVNCNIGTGTVLAGTYPNATVWAQAVKFLQIEIDPAGGSSFVDMGAVQIMSVPYANFADGSHTSNQSKLADSAVKAGSAASATNATNATNFTGQINPSQIKQNAANNGEVLKWNGSQWAPAADVGGGSGDNWGTQNVVTDATLAGNGVTGNGLRIAQQSANTGDVLAWNGSTWAPSAGGSVWTKTGNNINNNNSGLVGINNTNPSYQLDVTGNSRIIGSLGLNIAPSNTYLIYAQQTAKDNLNLLENTSAFNNTKLTLRASTVNDMLEIAKYGSSFSSTYADGTNMGGAGAIMAGTNANKFVAGTLGQYPVHLMTAGKTRFFIGKDGKIGINKTTPKAYIDFMGAPGTADSVDPGWGYRDYIGLMVEMDTVAASNEVDGIVGMSKRSSTQNNGIVGLAFGKSDSSINMGLVAFANNSGKGARIRNYGSYNVASTAKYNYGSYSIASGTTGTVHSYGVYGRGTSAANAIGVFGSASGGTTNNYGGYFSSGSSTGNFASVHFGNVSITGSISKGSGTFKIDHPQDPENKFLIHSFVESPDMMNVYNGNIVTDANGMANVSLPAYFEAENVNFKYQLTVIGQFAQAIVLKEIENNIFVIQTDKPNVKVSWQITGVRNDKFALANPVVPELEKNANEKGKYLHPELFGKPLSAGIFYLPAQTDPKANIVNK